MPRSKTPTYVKWLLPITIAVLTVSLLVVPYLSIFKSTFTNSNNTIAFLEQSSTFDYTSQIIKSEVEARLPQKVQQNLIERSIVNKLTDLIVTPKLVQNITEPVIKVGIKRLNGNQVLTLQNNNVQLDLEPYKQNLSSYVDSFKLAEGINSTINSFITSVPSSITIVNGQENPDSVLIKLVKMRESYGNIIQSYTVFVVLIVISLVSLLVLLFREPQRLFRVLAKIFAISGVVVLILSYIAPALISNLIPTNLSENSGSEISQLINSLVSHFFELSRGFVWYYIGISLVACLVAWYFKTFGIKFSPKDIKHYFVSKYHKIVKRK